MGYKVKPPKCSCEFWRRERRVKKAFNPAIVELKNEMKEIKQEIETLDRLRNEICTSHRETCLRLDGLLAERRTWLTTTGDVSSKLLNEIRLEKLKRKENICKLDHLAMTRYRLFREIQAKHKQCLAIRQTERMI